jgi:DNA modification methylase
MRIIKRPELGKLVTPLPNERLPVHNWFMPKEGFSRDFVAMVLNSFWVYKGDLVLDPFLGGGTTCLTCKEFGIDSLGLEVHPLMLLASKVKTRDYSVRELAREVEDLISEEPEPSEPPGQLARYFPPHVLRELWGFRERVLEAGGEERDFFLLALIRAAIRCSWVEKDGSVIKVRERPVPPFRETFRKVLGWMLDDLERLKTKEARTEVRDADARCPLEEEVDAVITSPPYLNKEEYQKAYWVEEEICGLERRGREAFLGSGPVGGRELSVVERHLEGEESQEVLAYFCDMFRVLENLYNCCRDGAKLALVTSDAGFSDRVVEVCLPLSRLAEEAGFKAKKMLVVNERFCTTPSRRKIGKMQEAVIFLEKAPA